MLGKVKSTRGAVKRTAFQCGREGPSRNPMLLLWKIERSGGETSVRSVK